MTEEKKPLKQFTLDLIDESARIVIKGFITPSTVKWIFIAWLIASIVVSVVIAVSGNCQKKRVQAGNYIMARLFCSEEVR